MDYAVHYQKSLDEYLKKYKSEEDKQLYIEYCEKFNIPFGYSNNIYIEIFNFFYFDFILTNFKRK